MASLSAQQARAGSRAWRHHYPLPSSRRSSCQCALHGMQTGHHCCYATKGCPPATKCCVSCLCLVLLPLLQGALGDPRYFDFICFSQFAAASRALSEGKQVGGARVGGMRGGGFCGDGPMPGHLCRQPSPDRAPLRHTCTAPPAAAAAAGGSATTVPYCTRCTTMPRWHTSAHPHGACLPARPPACLPAPPPRLPRLPCRCLRSTVRRVRAWCW